MMLKSEFFKMLKIGGLVEAENLLSWRGSYRNVTVSTSEDHLYNAMYNRSTRQKSELRELNLYDTFVRSRFKYWKK
jgi:hypothetical protein